MNAPLNLHVELLKLPMFIHDITIAGSGKLEVGYDIMFFDSDHTFNPEIAVSVVKLLHPTDGLIDVTECFDDPAKEQFAESVLISLGYTQ